MIFLFGGEKPPNKKGLFHVKKTIIRSHSVMKRNFGSIPEGREFIPVACSDWDMIRFIDFAYTKRFSFGI